MKIILSPAKKMRIDTDSLPWQDLPEMLDRAETLKRWLQGRSDHELKQLWACSDKIAQENLERLSRMELQRNLTPAILAYDGIAYQYMAPSVFAGSEFDYVQKHLRILSAFYGVLKPMDGVVPYRLEMQAKAKVNGAPDLYAFWGDALYRGVRDDSGVIINLASREYSRCISLYLSPTDRMLTCIFGELSADGTKVVQKGVYAKMARGEMVRYMAENSVELPEQLQGFDRLGYTFCQERSGMSEYVFLRESVPAGRK